MGGYRDRERLSSLDRITVGYGCTKAGMGFLAISLGILITGGSLVYCALAALVGIPLLAYGMRNP